MKKFKCRNAIEGKDRKCINRYGKRCDFEGRCQSNCKRYNRIYAEDRPNGCSERSSALSVSE
jgi:hypothetical protein